MTTVIQLICIEYNQIKEERFMMHNKNISIIRNILGGLLIFMGFVSVFSTSPVPGVFLALSGVAFYYQYSTKRYN